MGRIADDLDLLDLFWSEHLLAEATRSLVEKKGLPLEVAERWAGRLPQNFPNRRVQIPEVLAGTAKRRIGYTRFMRTLLPLLTKREIAREMRLGSLRTDDAVLRTLRTNKALSKGLSGNQRANAGRLGGTLHLYCALNRDAARALRLKDKGLAQLLAQAATRVEALPATRTLTDAIQQQSGDPSPRLLAHVFADPALTTALREVDSAIARERRTLPSTTRMTVASGQVTALKDLSATIALDDDLAPLAVPRELLREEDLDEEGAVLAARWELMGDGMSLFAVEPAIDLPATTTGTEEPLVDIYGTPWGQILTEADSAFVQSIVDAPRRGSIRRPPIKITIGE